MKIQDNILKMQLVDYEKCLKFFAAFVGWNPDGQALQVLDEVKPLTKAFWKTQFFETKKC